MVGKVIDVEFRPSDRGRWCVRCDEPFPEGTAMCPRCGGELLSAARHRASMQAQARRAVRRLVALGATVVVILAAIVVLLVLGVGSARGDEKASAAPTADSRPPDKKPEAKAETKAGDEKKTEPRPRKRTTVVATAKPAATTVGTAEIDAPLPGPRAVRVRLLDGSTVVGTVHAEEAQALVIDCSLGLLSIPRGRISTIAYDGAAGVGQKRAPVQQLDDEDVKKSAVNR